MTYDDFHSKHVLGSKTCDVTETKFKNTDGAYKKKTLDFSILQIFFVSRSFLQNKCEYMNKFHGSQLKSKTPDLFE